MSRADAAAKLIRLQEDDEDDDTYVLFRSASEPGAYALSTISDRGRIRHYKVRELDRRLGICEAGGEVQNYMDVAVFLHMVQGMGILVRAPQPRPLFPAIK